MRKSSARKEIDFECDDEAHDVPRAGFFLRLFGGNPAARVGSAGLAALVVAILVNVVFLQDQRHAAPLFKMSLRSADSDAPASTPLPSPRPAELAQQASKTPVVAPVAAPALTGQRADVPHVDPIAREIAKLDQSAPRLDRPRTSAARTADIKRDDSIANLIKNTDAAQQAAAVDVSVAAAQRALVKLGFVLRPDGVFGAGTRQAIETFERDNRLPVRGELSPKIKAELARQSGVEIR
ncbi:MAG: peptidoglycan-binding protein [Hyphomicrobiales bacterium]|nr:peptidoglycan-binding protein [Hyphomicrobiales bacterium]